MSRIVKSMDIDPKLRSWAGIGLSLTLASILGVERLRADDELPPGFAPVLTRFEPVSGYPGDTIVLFGTNLVQVKAVRFNDVDAVFIPKDPLFNPELRAVVPKNASSGPITVITDDGEVTSEEAFTVIPRPAPVVIDFSPKSGPENSSVNIIGEHLLDIVSIQFNGVPTTQYGDPSMSEGRGFPVHVPKGATTGPIIIVTEHGRVETAPFVVTAVPKPTILSMNPTEGIPGTAVMIRGQNLTRVKSVSFNGVNATFSEFGDLLVRVPEGATTGPVRVETEGGVAVSAQSFTAHVVCRGHSQPVSLVSIGGRFYPGNSRCGQPSGGIRFGSDL